MNRDSMIKGLAVLGAIALVLFVGFSITKTFLNASSQDLNTETSTATTLDANDALKATLDTLENSWEKVQSYSFVVGQDPLYLGRVIKGFSYSQSGYKELEEESDIRLTATVIDNNPKAIIKYRGRSYVVQVGETIDGIYRVVNIAKQRVVLDHAGTRLTLISKPAQELEQTPENPENPGYSNNGNVRNLEY